jgi:hypothetical protein
VTHCLNRAIASAGVIEGASCCMLARVPPLATLAQVGVVCKREQAEGVCHVVIPLQAVLAQEWRVCEVVCC